MRKIGVLGGEVLRGRRSVVEEVVECEVLLDVREDADDGEDAEPVHDVEEQGV